jgi:hypothetical protein
MLTPEERRAMINKIRRFPSELEATVKSLTEEQLLTQYIPGEWSVAQNVHHLADSHMNAFIRLKLILTEDNPSLKPYDQDAWAERIDGFDPPIQDSIMILRGLHHRWVALWESLSDAEWGRVGNRPDSTEPVTPETLLKTYSRHGEAHIEQIRKTLAMGV